GVCRRCPQRTVLVGLPYNLCLRLLVTLRSMLPRHKGAKKLTQVVPSLRGLIEAFGTAITRPTENISSRWSLAYSSCWVGFSFSMSCFTIPIHPSQFHRCVS